MESTIAFVMEFVVLFSHRWYVLNEWMASGNVCAMWGFVKASDSSSSIRLSWKIFTKLYFILASMLANYNNNNHNNNDHDGTQCVVETEINFNAIFIGECVLVINRRRWYLQHRHFQMQNRLLYYSDSLFSTLERRCTDAYNFPEEILNDSWYSSTSDAKRAHVHIHASCAANDTHIHVLCHSCSELMLPSLVLYISIKIFFTCIQCNCTTTSGWTSSLHIFSCIPCIFFTMRTFPPFSYSQQAA